MKSRILIPVLMTLAVTLSAQNRITAQRPYFCDVEGCQLSYERTYTDNGTRRWIQTVTINEVTQDARGQIIRYQSEFRNRGGGLMYGGPVQLEARVDWDGEIGRAHV